MTKIKNDFTLGSEIMVKPVLKLSAISEKNGKNYSQLIEFVCGYLFEKIVWGKHQNTN